MQSISADFFQALVLIIFEGHLQLAEGGSPKGLDLGFQGVSVGYFFHVRFLGKNYYWSSITSIPYWQGS